MSITITVDSTTPTEELDAIAVLIAALGGRAGRTVRLMYEELTDGGIVEEPAPVLATYEWKEVGIKTEPDARPTPAPSLVSGVASAPSTSATVPAAPVVSEATVNIPLPPAAVPAPPVPPAPVAVVPPPPVTSGAAPVSPTPSQGAAVPLDGEGLPWDERIHSGNREMTAKGVWRRRKNTPDERWDEVRAELKQVMGATGTVVESGTVTSIAVPPTIASYTQLPDDATPGEVAAAFAGVQTEAALAFAEAPEPTSLAAGHLAPQPPAIPVPPTPPAAVPVPPAPVATEAAPAQLPDVIDVINAFLMRLTEAQMSGAVSIERVQAAAVGVGLTSVRDVRNRPDLIPAIETALGMGAAA